MHDAVMSAFLRRQFEDASALMRESDLVDIAASGSPPDRYLVRFTCRGLVRTLDGSIVEASEFLLGIAFPANYLRMVDPRGVVTWMAPGNVWHPNIAPHAHLVCIGRMAPGTGLVDLIDQCFETVTWRKVTMREDDALNHVACEWARSNRSLFPVDSRPLRRRNLHMSMRDLSPGVGRAFA